MGKGLTATQRAKRSADALAGSTDSLGGLFGEYDKLALALCPKPTTARMDIKRLKTLQSKVVQQADISTKGAVYAMGLFVTDGCESEVSLEAMADAFVRSPTEPVSPNLLNPDCCFPL